MYYYEGAIIKKKNIYFKGTRLIDTRISGHPILLPIKSTFDDKYIFYFTISSQVHHYAKDPDRYFLLKSTPNTGLKTNSIVDLKYVYKCEKENIPEMGYIGDEVLKALIDKFLRYNGVEKDSECEELIGLISYSK